MKIAKCGVCGKEVEVKPIEGKMPDLPPEWAVVSILGLPVINRIVCPPDLHAVATVLGVRL